MTEETQNTEPVDTDDDGDDGDDALSEELESIQEDEHIQPDEVNLPPEEAEET